MNEHAITVQRTARYFTLGTLHKNTQEVWIVLHGFAQLAAGFLKYFEPFWSEEKYIVAPEALNRFYTKGYSGRVAATWMTKEAREHDIQDYIFYLDKLVEELNIDRSKTKIITLGFSQGVATLTRWLHHSKFSPDALVLYAGEIALELRTKPLPSFLHRQPCFFIYGSKDPLLPAFAPDTLKSIFEGIDLNILQFDGVHEINCEVLQQVAIS